MKTYLLAGLAILLVCCFVGTAFAADSDADVEMLVFPDSYTASKVSNGGTISGVVKFEGDAPEMKMLEITKDQAVCGAIEKYDESVVVGEGNALKNTIVYLMDISQGKDFDKAAKLEMDQKGCQFTPHVQIVPVGVRLTMLNYDRVHHNVHIFSSVNKPVNKLQTKNRRKMPLAGVKKAEGPVSMKCDIHGWMSAWVAYVPHPYFAVTNEKGEFSLEDVPAGTYKLGYWHEACGTNSASPFSVTVEAGSTVTQDFVLKLKLSYILAQSNTVVHISFTPVHLLTVGELLTLPLNITGGENVSGYQATVSYDTSALRYVKSANGDYLPDGAFFIPPVVDGNRVTLAASSLAGISNGDGTLATITFEVVAVKDSTLTLSNVLLTNSAGQSSQPLVEATQITELSPLTNGIGVALPSEFISEVAFAPNSTYFIVKAKYPMLIGISERNILYGSCIITLHIPDGMPGFVFPIKTVQDASVDFLLSVGINLIPLGGTFLDALDLFSKIDDSQNRVLKIELHTDARHREPPDTEMECIVLLKHPVNERPNGIDVTIEQQYRDTDRGATRIFKVYESKRWNFDDGWAAPPAQVTVFDYPPFQLLPVEVQQYLLLYFSEFGTTESGLIPKETALLANYPNPFNPETWIPYQLAKPADVSISIYAADGKLVRTLALGHQPVGIYESRSRAAYWDGRNTLGEPVASGVYFYTLTAGEFTATRKMLIRK